MVENNIRRQKGAQIRLLTAYVHLLRRVVRLAWAYIKYPELVSILDYFLIMD